jgi:hypothetical protein
MPEIALNWSGPCGRFLISPFVGAAVRPYTGTGNEVMEELKATWEKALTVWWSVAWRTVLFGFLAGLPLGFAIGFFGAMLHLNRGFLSRLSILTSFLTSAVVGIWAIKNSLTKRFKDFRIVLLPLDISEAEPKDTTWKTSTSEADQRM